jgi:hypothetical protein
MNGCPTIPRARAGRAVAIELIEVLFPPATDLRGAVLDELAWAQRRGLVRIVDVLFAMRDDRGGIVPLDPGGGGPAGGPWGVVVAPLLGIERPLPECAAQGHDIEADDVAGLGPGDIAALARRLPPGRASAWMLVQHLWVEDLRDALGAAGAEPLAGGYLRREALAAVAPALGALVERCVRAERAAAEEGWRILRVLKGSRHVSRVTVAQTLEVLVDAGQLEPAAVPEALRALAQSGVLPGRPRDA